MKDTLMIKNGILFEMTEFDGGRYEIKLTHLKNKIFREFEHISTTEPEFRISSHGNYILVRDSDSLYCYHTKTLSDVESPVPELWDYSR